VLVTLTEWNEFRALDLKEVGAVMRGNVLVDLRNLYQADLAEAAGLACPASAGQCRVSILMVMGEKERIGPTAPRPISGPNRSAPRSPPLKKTWPGGRWEQSY
jgi:hypothetical protein